PQKIARRYLRNAVTVHNLSGLGALPGPGRPQKNHRSNISRGVASQLVGHRDGPFYSYFPPRKYRPAPRLQNLRTTLTPCGSGAFAPLGRGGAPSPHHQVPRPPIRPLFGVNPSKCRMINCASICVTVSIATPTTISSDVPPK